MNNTTFIKDVLKLIQEHEERAKRQGYIFVADTLIEELNDKLALIEAQDLEDLKKDEQNER